MERLDTAKGITPLKAAIEAAETARPGHQMGHDRLPKSLRQASMRGAGTAWVDAQAAGGDHRGGPGAASPTGGHQRELAHCLTCKLGRGVVVICV